MFRLLVFATWRLALLDRLAGSRDPILAAIAAKGGKEVSYHREYAAQWVVRLGDGTAESHRRMTAAVGAVWPLTGELFHPHPIEGDLAAAGVAVDPAATREEVDAVLDEVLGRATLTRPAVPAAGPISGPQSLANVSSCVKNSRCQNESGTQAASAPAISRPPNT